MVITAHPDDESLGFGPTIAHYAARGVHVTLVTATRGERGRWHAAPFGSGGHPGPEGLAAIRTTELTAAARDLGIAQVEQLGLPDGQVDAAWGETTRRLAGLLVAHEPDVVLTFGPDGAYGHPDHIAVSQAATAAVVAAAPMHAVSKLYYLAWPTATWAAYQAAFKRLASTVDGVERQAVPWADWSITTTIDTRTSLPRVRRAIACHHSQTSVYEALDDLTLAQQEAIWGAQHFYRAFSRVNGGRGREVDLFEGLARREGCRESTDTPEHEHVHS